MAIAPPPAPAPAGLTAGAVVAGNSTLQAAGEVVVEQVPERIAQLARTILLSGTVSEQKPGGALVLRTQIGELTIRSQTPLPLDKVLTLQIPPGAPPVRAQVFVVPGSLPVSEGSATAAPSVPLSPPVQASPQPASGLPPAQSASPLLTSSPLGPVLPPSGAMPNTGSLLSSPLPSPISGVFSDPASPAALASSPDRASPSVKPATPSLSGGVLHSTPPSPASTGLLAGIPLAPLVPGMVIGGRALAAPLQAGQTGQASNLAPAFPSSLRAEASGGLASPLSQINSPSPPHPTTPQLPGSQNLQSLLQKSGSEALQAVKISGLSEILAHLPAAVLAPTPTRGPYSPALASPLAGQTQPPSRPAGTPSEQVFSQLAKVITLPPGSQITVQILAITAPLGTPQAESLSQAAPISKTDMSAPAPLSGFVVGRTARGETLLTSPAGVLVLESETPLEPGSKIDLALLHVQEPAPESEPDALPRRHQDWPALQEALAAATAAGIAPRPAPALYKPEQPASSLLFLMAALRLNSTESLLGEDSKDYLQQSGQSSLLGRVMGETQQMTQSWARTEAQGSEWRSLFVPLPADSGLTRLALHSRREDDPYESSEKDRKKVQHIVVEAELSQLGPLLLDGYIRPRQMETVLHSQRTLPTSLRDELRQGYRDTLSALGWAGGLDFRTAADLWRSQS